MNYGITVDVIIERILDADIPTDEWIERRGVLKGIYEDKCEVGLSDTFAIAHVVKHVMEKGW